MKWQPTFTTRLLRTQDWVLSAMILGAVFIHGLAFYLIQAAAPEAGKKIISSARLSILDPKNPRDRAALEWIENRDPAAMACQTESPQPPHLFDAEPYQASYEKILPEPLPMVQEENQSQHPSLFPPGPVPNSRPSLKTSEKTQAALLSKISPSPSVALKNPTSFSPPPTNGEIPAPARFLVLNSGFNGEKSLFLLESSGNDDLDRYARHWLAADNISLQANQSSGWVRIYWGSEIWKKNTP